jgi:hypothetical protein
MSSFPEKLRQHFALVAICLLLVPNLSKAEPKPLDPGTVHVRVIKRGVNNWIALQEQDGVQLFGRIIAIGDRSFTLQLHNDPETTEVSYIDVAYLRTGFTAGQKVLMIGGIAAVTGFAAYGFIHIHNLADKPLAPPTIP